jgi:hypothetical protein
MNDKFVAVAKKILKEKNLVTQTFFEDSEEIYFIYKGVAFSVVRREDSKDFGRYSFYIYPKARDIERLAFAFREGDPDEVPQLFFVHSKELDEDGIATLDALFREMVSKDSGLEDVFERLLS